jgi:hypothetical protein
MVCKKATYGARGFTRITIETANKTKPRIPEKLA